MTARVIAGSLYIGATVLVAAAAAWPVYAGVGYVVLVAVASVVAAAIAVVATLRRWGGWRVAGLVAASFVVLAVPLAVPSRLGGPLEILRGLGEALAGVLFAWKDLVTVDLPVGDYRNLLVPALVVFLVGTCAALLLTWRTDAWANAAVVVGGGMVSFGLLFGSAAVSAPLVIGGAELYAPRETALGIAGLATALLWLAWRAHDERVRALQRAASASGVRVSRRPSRADRRRDALGAGMLVAALVAAAAFVPWAARGADRDVLRSATGPERQIAAAPSPLAGYRALFDDARSQEVLFTVTSDGAPSGRIRLATLDAYDGQTFRAGADGARFVRVPSTRDAGEGERVETHVEIGALGEIGQLGGIWMPTVGRVVGVEFGGDGVDQQRAADLADGFYYDAVTQAAVQTAEGGLREGDAYRVRAVEAPTPDLASVAGPGGAPGGPEAPESLQRWVENHASGTGGTALAGLIALLRERGFLSHALAVGDALPEWARELPDYSFQPSASGHSLARIDAMFARLLERENDPRAAASGNYVAAVGDDEQFAVAAALIAGELGFPARVVVGARLSSPEPGLATCRDGRCRAQDLSAWIEVLADDGRWVPVDVTPQWTRSPSLEVTEQRDPENVTEVRPDTVEEVVPPDPVQEDSARDRDDEDAAGVDLAWLWTTLRIAGVTLAGAAIVLGPFAAVVGAKAFRRRGRRLAPDPATRIAGGWEEYVDAAVDAGRDAPAVLTRSELAAGYATPSGAALAAAADRAVFSGEQASSEEADEFWRLVEEERRAFTREERVWRRMLAAVSLRSFVRLLAPRAARRVPQPAVGRGRRRPVTVARTAS